MMRPRPTLTIRRPGAEPGIQSGTSDAARFNRLPRPARRQEWSGQAEVVPRPESSPRTETNAGPELSRVSDLTPRSPGVMPSPDLNLLRSDRPKHRTVALRASVGST